MAAQPANPEPLSIARQGYLFAVASPDPFVYDQFEPLDVFGFAGARCDRIVAGVLARLGARSS
jgi:hypothetical protein